MSRFDHIEPIEGIRPDMECLSTYFAKIITSRHNQHAIVMILGSAGTGKSWGALDMAIETAKEVARIRQESGEQMDDWRAYFDFNNNLGCINRTEIKRVMSAPKKHNIILLDDIAVAWNARKYKDDFNIFLNDIIQTFRPNHNLVIMTLQSSFLIDKVPRSLAHYQIEMEQAYFDQGFSLGKVFKVVIKHRDNDLHYRYLYNGGKYLYNVFEAPEKAITDAYEIERARQLKAMNDLKEEEKEQEQQTLKKKDYAVAVIDGIVSEFGVSIGKACKIAGISQTYYNRVKA